MWTSSRHCRGAPTDGWTNVAHAVAGYISDAGLHASQVDRECLELDREGWVDEVTYQGADGRRFKRERHGRLGERDSWWVNDQ